jgi:hypothetical protein
MEPSCTSRAFDPLGDGTFVLPSRASIGTVISETHLRAPPSIGRHIHARQRHRLGSLGCYSDWSGA